MSHPFHDDDVGKDFQAKSDEPIRPWYQFPNCRLAGREPRAVDGIRTPAPLPSQESGGVLSDIGVHVCGRVQEVRIIHPIMSACGPFPSCTFRQVVKLNLG